MVTYVFDINNIKFSHEINDPTQLAAIQFNLKQKNDSISLSLDMNVEEHEDYISNENDYMSFVLKKWAEKNPNANEEDFKNILVQAISSYANIISPEEIISEYIPTKEALLSYLSLKRWTVETEGFIFGDMKIPSDDRAKLLLMGAAGTMKDDETAPFVIEGKSIVLTGLQFKAIYLEIIRRTKALFQLQSDLIVEINNGNITSKNEIDSKEWNV